MQHLQPDRLDHRPPDRERHYRRRPDRRTGVCRRLRDQSRPWVRHSSPVSTTTVERSRITAHTGASTDGGNLEIFNTPILLDDQPNAVGINLYNPNEGTYAIGATPRPPDDHQRGGQHSIGIRAIADSESSGEGESVDAT